jgi:DNA polymerase-1
LWFNFGAFKENDHLKEVHMPRNAPHAGKEETAAPHLLVLDGHNLLFRAFTSLPPTIVGDDGAPIHAVYGFASTMARFVREVRPSHLAVCFDPPAEPFRTALFPEYRANRLDPQATLDADLLAEAGAGPVEVIANLHEQSLQARHLCAVLGVPVAEEPGYEADDAMATLAAQADARGWQVTILSTDKDLWQMADERITILVPDKDGRRYGPAEIEARLGVPPRLVPDWKALAGDPSDNIPGVPGIGPKTAARLLQRYGDLDAVLAQALETPPSAPLTPRLAELLRGHANAVRRYRQVATVIRNLPLRLTPEGCPLPADARSWKAGELLERAGLRRREAPEPQP